jgi:hypothetical protein
MEADVLGQVNLDSALGQTLYALAHESGVEVCVEVGTWNGQGSTLCIARALSESSGHLISIELSADLFDQARRFYAHESLPVELIHGLALTPEDYLVFSRYEAAVAETTGERLDPGCFRRWYDEELEMARGASRVDVLRDIVAAVGHVDLAFLDGGEFTTFAEFVFLEPHTSRYMVLDDTNRTQSIKSAQARDWLASSPEWEVTQDEAHDRNGWLVARRVGADPAGRSAVVNHGLSGRA